MQSIYVSVCNVAAASRVRTLPCTSYRDLFCRFLATWQVAVVNIMADLEHVQTLTPFLAAVSYLSLILVIKCCGNTLFSLVLSLLICGIF